VSPDPYAWSADLDGFLVGASLAGAYALGTRDIVVPRWRLVCFGVGLALVLLTHVSPIAPIANNYLLSVHLLQNVAIAEWAPALCVLGIPPALAGRLGELPGARIVTHPAFALPVWVVIYLVWHLPLAYETALEHPGTLLHLEHASYFASGVLLWWPVLQERPHAVAAGVKAGYLFLAFVLVSPIGLLLSLLPEPLYGFYEEAPRLWGVSAIADQQIAGVTMALEEALVFCAACSIYFLRFLREQEHEETVTSGSR
jgi:putative membrane protein